MLFTVQAISYLSLVLILKYRLTKFSPSFWITLYIRKCNACTAVTCFHSPCIQPKQDVERTVFLLHIREFSTVNLYTDMVSISYSFLLGTCRDHIPYLVTTFLSTRSQIRFKESLKSLMLNNLSHALDHKIKRKEIEISFFTYFFSCIFSCCRSQWPRGLRLRSTASPLLRSWVRIPPGVWMSVCWECCVLSGRGLCDELITHPEESNRLSCVVVCDLETTKILVK